MDAILDVVEVAEAVGLDGIASWVLRAVGFLLVVAGLGLWLLTDTGLFVLPAAMIGVGVVAMVATELLFVIAEVL